MAGDDPTTGIGDTRAVTLRLDFYDAELRRHNEHFRVAADVQRDDHVLDVGCGAGQSTRQAARAAVEGTALGVDVSAPMLERARQLSNDEGLRNVSYRQADAETCSFPRGDSICASAGSERCSSATPLPRSPTSGERCAQGPVW